MMKTNSFLLKGGLVLMMAWAGLPARIRADPSSMARLHAEMSARIDSPITHTESLQTLCERLMSEKRSIYYLNARSYKMGLQLRGIYTQDDALFFCLGLSNHSNMIYRIDSIRFYIADDKPVLRSSPWKPVVKSQAIAIHPLPFIFTLGNTRVIRGKTHEQCVIVLSRFTLPEKKHLVIEVSERNGGRRLQLMTDNFTIVRARLT